MNYDVQIGNIIRRGISYAELIVLPIEPNTFVRRGNGDWLQAKDCIELTHILNKLPTTSSVGIPITQTNIDNCSQEEYVEEEFNDYVDDEDEAIESIRYESQNQISPASSGSHPYSHSDREEEERIFIPTAEYFKCKQKRKAAIIGVCTLGLAGLTFMGVGNTWRSNIFAGTSFSANAGIGFVLKCLSFLLLTSLIAIPYFVYSVFALIYYSIRLKKLKSR